MYITNVNSLPIKSVVVSRDIADYIEKKYNIVRLGGDGENIYFIWNEKMESYIKNLPLLLKIFGRYKIGKGG